MSKGKKYKIPHKYLSKYPMRKEAKKIGIPLWTVLIMLITSIIPFANIVEFIAFWVVWLKYYLDPEVCCRNDWYTYWRFKDKFFSREI